MEIRVGTSGYSYKEWKGRFYPVDLPANKMLRFYADHFSTVEINNTFYRMPSRETFAQWAAQVPSGFRFVLKAPQRITHQKRLAGSAEDVSYLFDAASLLGDSLGPVLFQLPPFFKKDLERLHDFLEVLPRERRVAFEFRHESWSDPATHRLLQEAGAALCVSQTDEKPDQPLVSTAEWGYLRLRKTDYGDDELQQWSRRILDQPWNVAYVFFKHEDEGKGPQFARRFRAVLSDA